MKRLSFVLTLTLAAFVSPASAQTGKTSAEQLVITAAFADGTYITIEGVNFGSNPAVFLGGRPLGGVTVSGGGTQISALDPRLPPGTYLLHVSAGIGTQENGTFALAVGTGGAGTPGPPGPTGPQGPPGPAGPALASLDALAGTPCTVGGRAGTVAVSVAADGVIALRCVVVPDPPQPPESDVDYAPFSTKTAYFEAFRAFKFPAQFAVAIPGGCVGSISGAFSTGVCWSTFNVSITTDFTTISEPSGPTPLGTLGSFRALWQMDASAVMPLEIQIVGIGASCSVVLQAPNMNASVDFTFDRRDATKDVITLQAFNNLQAQFDLSNCAVLGDLGNFVTEVVDSIRGNIGFRLMEMMQPPTCRARDSMTFAACAAQ